MKARINLHFIMISDVFLGRAIASYARESQQFKVHHFPSGTTSALDISDVDSLIVLKGSHTRASILGVTSNRSIIQISCTLPSSNSAMKLNFLGPTPFPTTASRDIPAFILPVDPMGWSFTPEDSQSHDSLLSISQSGVLAFWMVTTDGEWRSTGKVHTQRTNVKLAKCSTAKKSALGES